MKVHSYLSKCILSFLAGHENDVIQLVSGNLPDTINIPGSVTLNMETKITAALPMDLISELSLKKMDPFPVPVPCLNGFGSCPYDGCMVMNQLCKFAKPQCACPLQPGNYKFDNVALNLPDLGDVLDTLMVVSSKQTIVQIQSTLGFATSLRYRGRGR